MSNPIVDSWRRLRAATWARSLEFMRDKSAVGWNLVFPLMLVLGLGYMFSGPGQALFKVAVLAPGTATLDADLHPFLSTPQVQFYRESELAPALHKVQLQRTPRLLQMLAQLLPLTHLVSGARAIRLDGAGLHAIAPNLLALTAMSAIYLVLGAAMFKWRQN